ncbi:MAG: hypothetical protein HC810_00440 [Acaryochloridaceae cyanobacterium RL_2_7]|nr:hypothetical protein [Acaryochloridaceae cyanobacterium RL_2_7]
MFKKLGLVGCFCLLAVGGGFAFVWRQFTQLPDWYTETAPPEKTSNILESEAFDAPEDLVALEQKLKDKLSGARDAGARDAGARDSVPRKPVPQNTAVTLNEQEFNELIVVAANKSKRTQPFLDGIQGIKTEIQPESIKSEVVVNLSKVNRKKLHPSQLQMIDQLSRQIPSLAQDDLLLTFKGKPQVQEGQLKLQPNTEISIGGIHTTLDALSERFGIDLTGQPINLNLGNLNLQTLQFEEEALSLKTKS